MGWSILIGIVLFLIGIASIFCGNPLHRDATDHESDYGGSGGDFGSDGGGRDD